MTPASTHAAQALQSVLDRRGTLPVEEIVTLLRHLLDEVRTLHAAGRLHRAIDPTAVTASAQTFLASMPFRPMADNSTLSKAQTSAFWT